MGTHHEVLIYYFSGTGNARNVAVWMSEVATKNNIPSRIINIAQIDRLSIEAPPTGALLVFVSPIHGFNYPPVMFHFIARFPRGHNHVVFMNTRAGMLIGKWITPGLTGIAFFLSSLLFKIKGYSIKGFFPVDLPSNWISLHPGLNERTVRYLHQKNKENVYCFAQTVFEGESHFKALREVIQDAVISPVSVLYYFIGRFFFSKTYYASSDCNNCGICIKNCPVKAIRTIDKRPYWTFKCESCMQCMSNCPQKAIETAHGVIIVFIVLTSFIPFELLYKYLARVFKVDHAVFHFVLESACFILTMGLMYRLVHYLLRFRFFERMVVYTSLTKYKFWGRRYKAPKADS